MAPHVSFWIVARGINMGHSTRMYFSESGPANFTDWMRRGIDLARGDVQPGMEAQGLNAPATMTLVQSAAVPFGRHRQRRDRASCERSWPYLVSKVSCETSRRLAS